MKCPKCGYENKAADAPACGMCSAPLGARAARAAAPPERTAAPEPGEVEGARVVRIERQQVQMPRSCPCCLGAPDTSFEVTARVEGNKRLEDGPLVTQAVRDVRTARLTFPICGRCLRHARLDRLMSASALLLGVAAFAAVVWRVGQDPDASKAFSEGGGAALCIGLSALGGAGLVALISSMILQALVSRTPTCAATEYPVEADLPSVDSPVVVYKFTNGAYGARFKAANQ